MLHYWFVIVRLFLVNQACHANQQPNLFGSHWWTNDVFLGWISAKKTARFWGNWQWPWIQNHDAAGNLIVFIAHKIKVLSLLIVFFFPEARGSFFNSALTPMISLGPLWQGSLGSYSRLDVLCSTMANGSYWLVDRLIEWSMLVTAGCLVFPTDDMLVNATLEDFGLSSPRWLSLSIINTSNHDRVFTTSGHHKWFVTNNEYPNTHLFNPSCFPNHYVR